MMSFGLLNASAMSQKMASNLFKNVPYVNVYMDLLIWESASTTENTKHLIEVCSRIKESGIKIKLCKYDCLKDRIGVLGCNICEIGLKADHRKISCSAIARLPVSKKRLKSFLMLCSFNQKFVPGLSRLAAPLHSLVEKREKFQCTKGTVKAINALRAIISNPPLLTLPKMNQTFHILTEASKDTFRTALVQRYDHGKMRVAQFGSRSLSKVENATAHSKNIPQQ